MTVRNATLERPASDRGTLASHETDKRIAGILNGSDNDPLPCHVECSIEKALDVLGGKWTFLIIRDLQGGKKRVVTRTAYATIPPTVEYALTEKGESLHPIIKAMKLWGAKWG